MNTIETKTKYPCDECKKKPKNNCICDTWKRWFGEAWVIVTAEVKAADERSKDD